jgi:hypothetical protein
MAKWPIVKPRGLHKKWKITLPPPREGGISADGLWGKKYENWEEKKQENIKETGRKGKEKRKCKDKGSNKCKIGRNKGKMGD